MRFTDYYYEYVRKVWARGMRWYKCSEVMPGQEHDCFYNTDIAFWSSEFLVSYNFGDGDSFFARCHLRKGQFTTAEWCHYHNEEEPYDECKDIYQKQYWNDEIIITHWALIEWPDGMLDHNNDN